MERKSKHCLERKKWRSRSNRMILIHSNVSTQMMLVHSNVSKFFKKQHTNTLYCFANRHSLDESSNIMDKKFFLKKVKVTSNCVFKKVRKIYVYKTPFTLKTMKLLRLRSVVDQIFKINTSRYLQGCFCESFHYLDCIFHIFDMN